MSPFLVFRLEDRRIAAHLNAVERLLRRRDTTGMPRSLQQRRRDMLDRLADYTQRGVFPRNRSGSFLTPVFVDSESRECAVAHLMGENAGLLDEIASSQNLARIGEMSHPSLHDWQRKCGLDVDELELVQPHYASALSIAIGALPGMLVMLAGIVGAWMSHGVRRLRFRLTETRPNLVGLISAVVAALAGWWLVDQARWAWALPDVGETLLGGAWRDVAYGMVVWMLMASGVIGVVFGLATVVHRIVTSVSAWEGRVISDTLIESLQRSAGLLATACLVIIGPLAWAFAVTVVGRFIPSSVFCASGRALRSQWLPLPHRQCLLEGEVIATSYVDILFVAAAIAPILWVIGRYLFRVLSRENLQVGSPDSIP